MSEIMQHHQDTEEPQAKHAPEGVLMAMSGGVDSSAAALLLKEQGYAVVGATMRLFDRPDAPEDDQSCGSKSDADDARAVANSLSIPHHILDYRSVFGEKVIDHFCAEYLQGRTPNPCIDCNRHLKFDALQKLRAELGLDYVATGHYVRRVFNPETQLWELRKGADPNKDQSYVLHHLSQNTLAHMLFPLGDLDKPSVRQLAANDGLTTANKKESQDICFVPDNNHASFIEQHIGQALTPGPIVDLNGKQLGTHAGLAKYTIGQRKGVGVAAGEPIFVIEKRPETNELVMGPLSALETTEVVADAVTSVSGKGFPSAGEAIRVEAKLNYRQKPQAGMCFCDSEGLLHVRFDKPVRACAPGQALVVYQGDVMLGGGTIKAGI